MQSNKIAIITNCTSRKRKVGHKVTLSGDFVWSSIDGLVMHWNAVLEANKGSVEVQDLYQGRSFSDARASTLAVDGDLYVVSAGLGLVTGKEIVPSYDLTISDGPGSIIPQLQRLRRCSSDWWSALTVARKQPVPILTLLKQPQTTQVWIAMPSTYLEMISEELALIDDNLGRQKLRIFTSLRGKQYLPTNIRACALPYDDRMESTEFSGTANDFPQRCLRHFTTKLHSPSSNLDEDTEKVQKSLEGIVPPIKPKRTKLSDEEIIKVIKRTWSTQEGSSTRLLRYLRDDAMISCEQGRFRNIWLKIKDEMYGTVI